MKNIVIAIIALIAVVVSILPGRAQGLPSGWADVDIANPPVPGSATYSSGTFTVTGSGYSGTVDQENFCYQQFTGNFVFTARLTSNTGWAGIAMRGSLDGTAQTETIYSPNTDTAAWIACRLEAGGSSVGAASYSGTTGPIWYRLIRYENFFYKYFSLDGTTWQPITEEDVVVSGLPATVDIGFWVARHNPTATATFDNVSVTSYSWPVTIPGKISTTWIGNTYGDGADYENLQADIDGMYVAPDGTCFANTWALDVSRMWGVYKGGICQGYAGGTGNAGGATVASDGTYLYYGSEYVYNQVQGTSTVTISAYGVRRASPTTWADVSFTGGLADGSFLQLGTKSSINSVGNIWGLTSNPTAQLLYASDNLTGKINLVNTTNMTVSSSWQVPSGYVPYSLCWDSVDSLLWAVVQNTTTGARQIWAYNAAGTQETALTISSASNPVSMTMYNGNLYVADNGPDQNIKVYRSLNTTPTLLTTYGVTGGAFSGTGATIGTAGPWRFNGLTSIGIDAGGNLYVAFNGHGPSLNEDSLYENLGFGVTLESYNLASQARNWTMHAMEYMDCVNFDPGDENTGFGATANYAMNWANTTPGTEWSLTGYSVNWLKYGNTGTLTDGDFRLNSSNTSHNLSRVVRIGGQPFLALGDTYHLDFYRFNSSTDGQVAIPAAEIVGTSIWTDTNGDGRRQSGENASNGGVGYLSTTDVDTNTGDVYGVLYDPPNWHHIYKYSCSLLSNGVPQYSQSAKTMWDYTNLSASDTDTFTQINQLSYDHASDTLFMLGFTTAHPRLSGYSGYGTVVKSYSHWHSTPTFNWESVLPITDTGNQYTAYVMEAMANAGNYVFMQYIRGYKTLVLSKADGSQVGTILPDPNTVGEQTDLWVDYYRGLSAYQRANGEYDICVEDDIFNKSVIYRWMPWTDLDIGNVGLAGGSTWDPATNTYTITGSGYGIINTTTDACHFTYMPVSGNFTLIGQITSVNCSTNPYPRSGFVVRSDLTPGAQYASLLLTPPANDRLGVFFRSTENGSTSGGSNLGSAPVWVKLVRSGTTFTGYYGSDGIHWTQWGASESISMGTNAYVGFEVSSLSTATQATMTVTNVSLTSP